MLDEGLEAFGEGVPGDGIFDVGLLLLLFGAHGVIERAHGFTFAKDFESDALIEIAEAAAVGEEGR